MPFVIIVDSTGEVVSRHVGYNPGDEKELEIEILHLLMPNATILDSLNLPPSSGQKEISKSEKSIESSTEPAIK